MPNRPAQVDVQTPRPLGAGPEVDPPRSELMRKLEEKQRARRNIERQQKIISDTDKLVALAAALKAAVDSQHNQPAAEAQAKEAAEIEKLARSVKEKMRAE